LTSNGKKSENSRKKRAPQTLASSDPRILALVRMLARRAAERDYARLLETHGKAQKPSDRKE
jgi:hypothetical protein